MMRQLESQEIQAVSGGGVLTNSINAGVEGAKIAGAGLVSAGKSISSGLATAFAPVVTVVKDAWNFWI